MPLPIQGKSRMRQSRSYGSVRGVRGNSHPYRDIGLCRLSRSHIYQGTTDHERRWSVPPGELMDKLEWQLCGNTVVDF